MASKPKKADNFILLTIFLKHQQYMNLQEIGAKLPESKLREIFPPKGVGVESW